MKMDKPILAKRIFWDTDFEKLEYDKNYKSIIARVFDRGDIEDIRQVRRYYGDEKVIEALTTAKYLFDETINFCSGIFEIPKENFRCYILKQSYPVQSGF
jgi:nicotinamide mononucleotide adenylyltransferase